MCLIAFAWNVDPARPLVMIANRDEFQDRPAAPLGFWDDAPELAAGRDLREHGTWLGLSRRGRLAAVTNVRDPADFRPYPRSRGALTTDFLLGHRTAADHAARLVDDAQHYGGFNLLLWDGTDLVYASNRPTPNWYRVGAGVHGLSNARLDTPWPKTVWARHRIADWMRRPTPADGLLQAMTDRSIPEDAALPDTGVGLESERLLSPPFIWRPGYGTRCTTWVQVSADGEAQMRERRYDDRGEPSGDTDLRFGLILAR
jgi:uncharacterized protein with NRDE domain